MKLRWPFRQRRREQELDEELRSHLAMSIQERIAQGEDPAEAETNARREFGNVGLVKDVTRDMWGWRWLETLLQDLHYGLRQLRRNPVFTIVAILTLALGIGANTAIFTLVDQVMLKPLPVSNPSQLFRLGDRNDCCVVDTFQDHGWSLFSYALYKDLRDHTPEFGNLAAFYAGSMQLTVRWLNSSALAKRAQGELVSGNYFRMFGIRAFAGRVFTSQDDRRAAPRVAVMSYYAWTQDFGRDPAVIGATFAINTIPFTLIGITPPGFFGDTLRANPPDFWVPLSTEPALDGASTILNHPGENWLYSIGRLKPGTQPRQVQSQMTVELQRWLRAQDGFAARHKKQIPRQFIPIAPAGDGIQRLQSNYASGLRLLMILAGVVLLIACANIANLLLARGAARRQDTAVRVALGASRRRMVLQALTECMLLAVAGGLVGLYVAYAGAHAILLLAFRGAHYVPLNVSPSLPVLGFTFGLSLVTGIVFGLVPAWMNSRSKPADVLRGTSHSTDGHGSFARRALVVVQVAMCTILLVSAALLAQSLRNLQDQPYGFQTQGRWIVKVNPVLAGIKPNQLYPLYQQLGQRLYRIPGVLSASYSLYSPMEGNNWSLGIHIEGRSKEYGASWDRIAPHYFETIGTPLLRGRTVTADDTPTSQRVAVVNEAFARNFFPHTNPIGRHFGIGGLKHASDYEIVGVVGDAKYSKARAPVGPTFFVPFLQTAKYNEQDFKAALLRSNYMGSIELQVAGDPENLEVEIRRALGEINPNLTVLKMMSFGEQLNLNFNQDRLLARLTELFGLLALVLACVGLYGVTSYSVARRTNEIGIRMALGAEKRDVLRMVIGQGLKLALIGVAIGVAGALALTRFLSSLLYGVTPTDPLTFVAVSLILIAVALLACYIPARRAAKVDPMVALRCE